MLLSVCLPKAVYAAVPAQTLGAHESPYPASFIPAVACDAPTVLDARVCSRLRQALRRYAKLDAAPAPCTCHSPRTLGTMRASPVDASDRLPGGSIALLAGEASSHASTRPLFSLKAPQLIIRGTDRQVAPSRCSVYSSARLSAYMRMMDWGKSDAMEEAVKRAKT